MQFPKFLDVNQPNFQISKPKKCSNFHSKHRYRKLWKNIFKIVEMFYL